MLPFFFDEQYLNFVGRRRDAEKGMAKGEPDKDRRNLSKVNRRWVIILAINECEVYDCHPCHCRLEYPGSRDKTLNAQSRSPMTIYLGTPSKTPPRHFAVNDEEGSGREIWPTETKCGRRL
ncbi:MAG TPA: hypothetical protein VGO47_05945 [Chlamydiales bacterium]|jgi:hypothetical protein|nr:hypothetical protein [Chlamydiales bacterium]